MNKKLAIFVVLIVVAFLAAFVFVTHAEAVKTKFNPEILNIDIFGNEAVANAFESTTITQLYSPKIVDRLVSLGLTPVTDSRGNLNLEVSNGKQTICVFNHRTVIRNLESNELDTFLMKKDESGLLEFGDWESRIARSKMATAIFIPGNFPKSTSCVSVVKADTVDSNGYGQNLLLLLDRNTGEIMGEVQFIYGIDTTVNYVDVDGWIITRITE